MLAATMENISTILLRMKPVFLARMGCHLWVELLVESAAQAGLATMTVSRAHSANLDNIQTAGMCRLALCVHRGRTQQLARLLVVIATRELSRRLQVLLPARFAALESTPVAVWD